jgi:hypothetical protein
MMLHNLLGKHVADVEASRWERGYFVSRCIECGSEMIKLPGQSWRVRVRKA